MYFGSRHFLLRLYCKHAVMFLLEINADCIICATVSAIFYLSYPVIIQADYIMGNEFPISDIGQLRLDYLNKS